MTIDELRPYQDKTVVLHLDDGEIASVKIIFVHTEYGDITVDIVHTNRLEKYKGLADSAYAILAADIASVDEISNFAAAIQLPDPSTQHQDTTHSCPGLDWQWSNVRYAIRGLKTHISRRRRRRGCAAVAGTEARTTIRRCSIVSPVDVALAGDYSFSSLHHQYVYG
jgi:hypothetical protein